MVSTSIERRKIDGHTACYRLFNYSYPIITQMRFFNEINKEFNPITRQNVINYVYGASVDDVEKRIGDSRVTVNITVPMLIKLNNIKAPIAFVDSDDAHAIMLDIEEHIADWVRALNNPFVKRDPPPFRDFLDMNTLAESIFTVGKIIVRNMERNNGPANLGLKKWLNIDVDDYDYKDKYDSKINDLIHCYNKNMISLSDDEEDDQGGS